MPSQRHTSSVGPLAGTGSAGVPWASDEQADALRELPPAIVEATRAAVLAVGVRRTTLTDVARRAGVSRMTVYRLVPDVETLVLQVMTAEFAALVARAEQASARRRTARARLVGSVLEIVRSLPTEPLFTRVLDVDPDLLLPFITDRFGSTQRIALGHVRRMLAEGHADGSIRRADLDAQAMALLLTCTPFVLSAPLLDRPDSVIHREALLRELAAVLDRGLAA